MCDRRPHWSESPDLAARIREIYDSIAPREWDVHVWDKQGATPGRIDIADAHRLIARVLQEV